MITDLVLGATSGGIVGIFGSLIKVGLDIFQENKREQNSIKVQELNNAHELKMAERTEALMKLEAAHADKLAAIEVAGEVDEAALNAIGESYKWDKAAYSNSPDSSLMLIVDFCRGMIRPSLTLFFAFAIAGLTVYTWYQLPEAAYKDPVFLKATLFRLVDSIIFLGSTTIGWWFAARPTSASK